MLAAANANGGLVNRSDIAEIYGDSGSDEKSADKAIGRWVKAGKLVATGKRAVYEVSR